MKLNPQTRQWLFIVVRSHYLFSGVARCDIYGRNLLCFWSYQRCFSSISGETESFALRCNNSHLG